MSVGDRAFNMYWAVLLLCTYEEFIEHTIELSFRVRYIVFSITIK